MIHFTQLHQLTKIANIKIEGEFNPSWSGKYHRVSRNNNTTIEPVIASGLIVKKVALNKKEILPNDILDLAHVSELIYTIVSNKFPILYTGITKGNLQTGVFGPGRLQHHVRKLLAALNSSTSHTQGWHEHANTRHKFLTKNINEQDLESALDDVFISFAHIADCESFEGTVFQAFKNQFKNQGIHPTELNYKKMKSNPSTVELPTNLDDLICNMEKPSSKHSTELGFPEKNYVNMEKSSSTYSTKSEFAYENYENMVDFKDPEDFDKFEQLLNWARSQSEISVVEKIVGKYTNQPSGLNGTPMVVFAELGSSGKALPHKWICRIPLKRTKSQKMSIVLPTRLLKWNIDQAQIETGKDANFKPKNIDQFIASPNLFLQF
jgi:hypothetical protein